MFPPAQLNAKPYLTGVANKTKEIYMVRKRDIKIALGRLDRLGRLDLQNYLEILNSRVPDETVKNPIYPVDPTCPVELI